MIFYLLLHILVSWFLTCAILRFFNLMISSTSNEFHREPSLLTSLFAWADIQMTPEKTIMAGRIVHHIIGIFFTSVYYLIWYYEFAEISLIITVGIGFVIGLLNIISWAILQEIIPAVRLADFKGYYLQQVFVHNIITIIAILIYWLF